MNLNPELKYYLPLIVYFAALPIISGDAMFITLIIELLSLVFIFLHRFLEEESVFYIYVFFALLAMVPAFYTLDLLSIANLVIFYSLLSLPIFHILIHKFERKYGKIDHASHIYYLSSLPLSFLLLFILLFLPLQLDVYAIIITVFIIALLLLYLTRS